MDISNNNISNVYEGELTGSKQSISLDAALTQIDVFLASGRLMDASRLLLRAERIAPTEADRGYLIDRFLLHGTLAGFFDATEILFTKQQLRHPQDEDLEDTYSMFRQIAGWDRPVTSQVLTDGSSLASLIHEELNHLLEGVNPLRYLTSLAALCLHGEQEWSLSQAVADWANLEELILSVGERVLPYRLEALLGEAWYCDSKRGIYPRLPHLQSVLQGATNVPAFADVVTYLCILQDISQRRLPNALDGLTTLIAGRSDWLWLRIIDLSAYFGNLQQWKIVCLWIKKQERQRVTMLFHPLLHAFAAIVVLISAGDNPPLLTSSQTDLLNKQTWLDTTMQVKLWEAQPTTSAVIHDLLNECILGDGISPSWTDLMHHCLNLQLSFLRAARKLDVVNIHALWKQLPEALRQQANLTHEVHRVAVIMIGSDAPLGTPEFWLDILPLWNPAQPEALAPMLDQLSCSPERDWLLTRCMELLAKSQPEECRRWLKKHQHDFTKFGWSNLGVKLGRIDLLWSQEVEEISLSAHMQKTLRVLDLELERMTVGDHELKLFVGKLSAKEQFLSPILKRLGQLLSPPLFAPTSFEHWFPVHALRKDWARLTLEEKQQALDTLDHNRHPTTHRLLNDPLRPFLIDAANITLNEQIVSQGGGDPFTVLERIWAAAWNEGFYPILTYADASFCSRYKLGSGQEHLHRLIRERRIQVAANTGDHRQYADFDILAAINEESWQHCGAILTRDNYTKSSDMWTGMFPWLRGSYRDMRMDFSVSITGQLSLMTSSGQQIKVPRE